MQDHEEYWVLYEPKRYRSGDIRIKAWVTGEGMSSQERAAMENEAERLRKEQEEAQAEAARLALLAEEEAKKALEADKARITAEE